VLRNRGGFEVIHIANPASALDRARAERWDLVLTDVEMPGMTGIELLEAVREISPQLPVAVVTAHPSVDYAVRALRNKADEFLEKPVRPDKLVATVAALVARGRAAQEAARQSVLAIGAHPDDVEIGAAGTLAMHRRLGHEVSILTLSRGARGGTEDTRAGESRKAAEVIGATLYHEDLQDTSIREGDPTIGVISRIVETVRPTVIYTHSLHDVHQDHRNTHQAALVAVRQVGRVYCFQSPSATVDFRPTRFVAIDEQLDRKLQAIGAFSSQVEIRAYLEPDLIEAAARYWSRYCEGRYAEPFEVIREAAVAGQHELTPAKGIVRGENGAWAAAPDRRTRPRPRPRPDDQVPNQAPGPAPQPSAERIRGVPDGAR
jgi:LmbE family N-acetylglucosaminyl deacetylase